MTFFFQYTSNTISRKEPTYFLLITKLNIMGATGIIIGAAAVGSAAYFFYRYGQKQIPSEQVDELTVGDVAAYFKGKYLVKGRDVPFVATKAFFDNERRLARLIPAAEPGHEVVVLGIMNKESNSTTLEKVIYAKIVDDSLMQQLKNKGLVVLS